MAKRYTYGDLILKHGVRGWYVKANPHLGLFDTRLELIEAIKCALGKPAETW